MVTTEARAAGLFDRFLGCLLGGEIGDAMGAPAEGKTYQEIEARYGEIMDFSGSGTDDSALKHILIDAILSSGGYPTADVWAAQWLVQEELFTRRHLFWVPVMNSFWKLSAGEATPRECGHGTMASSSSAMCISPMGLINAGDARQAALETFETASLIHHNFCRDAACAMAAAVAEACGPTATVGSVLDAANWALPTGSAREMRDRILGALDLARACLGSGSADPYRAFRARYCGESDLPGANQADSRETVPVALALFLIADGDPRRTVLFGANFGRDADTIASMAGALAGTLRGASAFPAEWVAKVRTGSPRDHDRIAQQLIEVMLKRADEAAARRAALRASL